MNERPIARCEVNGVDAYDYPFFVKPANGMEPAYLFLEDHVYNFTTEDEEIMLHLIRIDDEKDLLLLGYEKNGEGIYVLPKSGETWPQGGKE